MGSRRAGFHKTLCLCARFSVGEAVFNAVVIEPVMVLSREVKSMAEVGGVSGVRDSRAFSSVGKTAWSAFDHCR